MMMVGIASVALMTPLLLQSRPAISRPCRIIACAEQETQFVDDALSLVFASPIVRVNLGDALPKGTLEALEKSVVASWNDHLDAQQRMASGGKGHKRRASADTTQNLAASSQELNEEFFFFQREKYGDFAHTATPHANASSWMASDAGQAVIRAVTTATGRYLARIAHHADADDPVASGGGLEPSHMHAWASLHQGGSTHPRHVHAGAVVSSVLYVRSPPGSGRICFHDPRGNGIPPFERELCHEPRTGDLLLFPPWLAHAVTSTPSNVEGPRISVSLNYVDLDDRLKQGGPAGWGEATAALEVLPVERFEL